MIGHIEKRKGPRGTTYRVKIELPRDPISGSRRSTSKTFRAKKDAEAYMAATITEINRSAHVLPSKLTIGDLLTDWLETTRYRVRPATLEGYDATIRNHLLPELGAMRVQDLTPIELQRFYNRKLAAGASARTIQLAHQRLSQALATGVKQGLIARNVADLVDPPRVPAASRTVWTAQECRTFIQASRSHRLDPFWMLAISTGLRRGQLLGLRWQDIDFEQSKLSVHQSVGVLAGAPTISAPKTAKSRRDVLLPATVTQALHDHLDRAQLKTDRQPAELVFSTSLGGPIHPNNLSRSFNAIIQSAGLPRIRFHDLRHTHATLLLAANQPVHAVSERLGHARSSITLDVYAHVIPGMQQDAVAALDRLLSERVPESFPSE